jgi:hypothetical protein
LKQNNQIKRYENFELRIKPHPPWVPHQSSPQSKLKAEGSRLLRQLPLSFSIQLFVMAGLLAVDRFKEFQVPRVTNLWASGDSH